MKYQGEKAFMIPKKIHYCWFGRNELPKKAKKCIASWKKYCSDYEIVEWNEDNLDVNLNAYTKMCYEQKKYAFLTDYLRLLIIMEHGGIYFDTDVEVMRAFDDLLDNKAFFGFENREFINTGLGFGAEAGNKIVGQMIKEYDELLDGEQGTIGCPILNTSALIKLGLHRNGEQQCIDGVMIYPIDYFNPYDDLTGRLRKTQNSHSIHWYAKSWMDKKTIIRSTLTKPLHRLFGTEGFRRRKSD